MIRRSRFGFGQKPQPSGISMEGFAPTKGYTEDEPTTAQPGSITSGANVWVDDNALQPRWRLAQLADNAHSDVINGAEVYNDLDGAQYVVATSQDTIAYLPTDMGSWTTLRYVSGTSNIPPTGGEGDLFFGDEVYIPRADLNWFVFTNGVDPLYVWGGPSDGTGYSTLTQAPIAKDVVVHDNRIVAWNIRELSSATRYTTRVQWPVSGDPEDWNVASIGAGYEDLLNARGEGTRIFADEDELILATTKEIWRGRRVGLPFVFSYSQIKRGDDFSVGMPYPKAALQTPHGIFWLGADYLVYRMEGEQVTPVGVPIWDTLRRTLQSPDKAFFSYLPEQGLLTLHYSTTVGAYPANAFTLHVEGGQWTPQTFSHNLTQSAPIGVATSATTWGGLTGTLGAQTKSWAEMLGAVGARQQSGVFTSAGTTAYFTESAGSDLGSTVEAYARFAPMFTGDMSRVKWLDEVRFDGRADQASTLSIGMGSTNSTSFAISAQSDTTQYRYTLGLSATYHTPFVSSNDTGWKLTRIAARARSVGESW